MVAAANPRRKEDGRCRKNLGGILGASEVIVSHGDPPLAEPSRPFSTLRASRKGFHCFQPAGERAVAEGRGGAVAASRILSASIRRRRAAIRSRAATRGRERS